VMSGERVIHQKVSESHKPNESDNYKRNPPNLTLFATKRDMRELREDPSTIQYVPSYKGDVSTTNNFTNRHFSLLSLFKDFEDVFSQGRPPGRPPLPLHEQVNMNFDKQAVYIMKFHEDKRGTLEKHNEEHAKKMNKHKRAMIFEERDLVWLHLRKDCVPDARKSKLHPRGDEPFKVIKRINDNAYKIDISNSKYLVHDTFNVVDLSPYLGTSSDEEDQESRTTLTQGGEMM